MNFDDLLQGWRAQDGNPPYGLNKDLLQLVLQGEQDRIRRFLRRDLWVATVAGASMVGMGAVWLVVLLYTRGPVLQTVAAALATVLLGGWIIAFLRSRRQQARRERGFGNTLQEEIRRNLSLVEYQLSNGGRRGSALRWVAPPLIGALLIHWLVGEINDIPWSWTYGGMPVVVTGWVIWMGYTVSGQAERKLEARRQRLRELLEAFDAEE